MGAVNWGRLIKGTGKIERERERDMNWENDKEEEEEEEEEEGGGGGGGEGGGEEEIKRGKKNEEW